MMINENTSMKIREVMIEAFQPEGILPPEVTIAFRVGSVEDCEGLSYWTTETETMQCEIDPLILDDVKKAFSEESTVPINYTGAVVEIHEPNEVYKLMLVRLGFRY